MKGIFCFGFAIVLICTGVFAEVDGKKAANDWLKMEKLLDEIFRQV